MERLAHKKLHPNIDFYSGIAFDASASPRPHTPPFAMGRVSGWLAHWME